MTSPDLPPLALDRPKRLAPALFFTAFGFSLLSVCLFRALAFTPASVAFFVLYLCMGMPVGALLVRWKSFLPWKAFGRSIPGLLALSAIFPLMAWLGAHSPDPLVSALYRVGNVSGLWKTIAWQALVTSPLFILWGYAEYAGYQVAIGSQRIKKSFYLIFVWALALAFGVGFYSIPSIGWLKTVLLAPFSAALAYGFWALPARSWLRKAPYAAIILVICWVLAGRAESGFQFQLMSDKPFHALTPPGIQPARGAKPLGKDSVVASRWGRYCHFSLVRHNVVGGLVAGCYDGVFHWYAHPASFPPYSLEAAAFDLVPENGDVCILGAGGGADLLWALRRNAGRVAAVDIIPEVFSLLKGEQAWVNGGIYNHPAVETICAEGRRFVETSGRKFDVIVLPHTESQAAAAKALFDPGQRMHTVEGFSALKAGLKDDGVLIVIKTLDRGGKLFYGYAASLMKAGYGVTGVRGAEALGLESFVIVASRRPEAPALPFSMQEMAGKDGRRIEYFEKAPLGVSPITDDSPWIRGILGSAFPRRVMAWNFFGLALFGLSGAAACLVFSMRNRKPGQTARYRFFLTTAGIMIGANAILLENAMIFWFIRNLMNPLSAFVAGTSIFLAIWGFSSLALEKGRRVAVLVACGAAASLIFGWAEGLPAAGCLGLMALGSGLAFPLLALKHPDDLMHLFVADMLGGLCGGLLGIWLPVLAGVGVFNGVLPWAWALAMILTGCAVRAGDAR